jgi:hypothetical protein
MREKMSPDLVYPPSLHDDPCPSLRPFLCLDFDFSRPKPEEFEPTKDMDKDLRRDSQILTE